jgi:EmrB/QacA subfamily drug resistance transporter
MAAFMVGLDAVVVSAAMPTMRAKLHASVATLGWTMTAYSLAFAALIMTGTVLGDRFGRRRVFTAGLALFTLASAACAASPTVGTLIIARAVQGAGGGLAMPLSLVLIIEAFPPQRRGAVIGVWGSIVGVAVGLGPLLGGAVVQGLNWQWIFWVNVPIGMVIVTVGTRRLAESRGPARRLDMVGLALLSLAVFCVTDALLRGPQLGWTSTEVLGLLVGAAGAAFAFRASQRRAGALLPRGLFANRAFTAAVLGRLALFAAIFGAAFLIPQYLQMVRGYQPLAVGVGMLPWTGPIMFVAPISGRLADRFGERLPIVAGLTLQTVGLVLLAQATSSGHGYAAVIAPLVLTGVGGGLASPACASAALRSVPQQLAGLASGVSATMQQIGGVVGIAVATAVFTSSGSYASPASFAHGLHPALLAVAGFAAVGAVVGLATRTRSA